LRVGAESGDEQVLHFGESLGREEEEGGMLRERRTRVNSQIG